MPESVIEEDLLIPLTLLNSDVDLSNNVAFVIQITIVLLFSTMIFGFAIKKLMQIMKG